MTTDTPLCGQRCPVPGLSVPFSGGRRRLGTWQQIIFIDPGQPPKGPEVDRADRRGDPTRHSLDRSRWEGFCETRSRGTVAPSGADKPHSRGFYMEWVLIYQVWGEENSTAIGAEGCCWLSTCKIGVQPDRMQKRYVQARYLSPGFGDFGRLACGMSEVGWVV